LVCSCYTANLLETHGPFLLPFTAQGQLKFQVGFWWVWWVIAAVRHRWLSGLWSGVPCEFATLTVGSWRYDGSFRFAYQRWTVENNSIFFNETESFGILQGNFACLPYFVMHTFLNSFCVLTQVWCRKKVDCWY
jgi:hypothetical protein